MPAGVYTCAPDIEECTMNSLIKKAAGILLGAALAAALNTAVFADGNDVPLPEEPKTEILEYIEENTPAEKLEGGQPAGISPETVEELPAQQAETLEEEPVVNADPGVGASAPGSIAGIDIDRSADVTISWENGSGCRYIAESDRVVMVNYDGSAAAMSTDEKDLTIVAAGLNRLASISCNGNVNLIGTGILLVDDIQLAEECSFNLLPDSSLYDSGSVAVFLKESDGVYKLINGSVTGILDEAYSIPGDLTLIIPEDASLLMSSTGIITETYTDPDTQEEVTEIRRYTSAPEDMQLHGQDFNVTGSAANLKIKSGTKLVIEKGGSLNMRAYDTVPGKDYSTKYLPVISVEGELELDGDITGTGTVLFADGSGLSGDGVLACSAVEFGEGQTAQTYSLNVADCNVTVWGGNVSLDELHVSGDTCINYRDNLTVNDTVIDDGATLSVRVALSPKSTDPTVSFKGSLSGGSLFAQSGTAVISSGCKVDGTSFAGNNNYCGNILDYSQLSEEQPQAQLDSTTIAPLVINPATTSTASLADGKYTIPVYDVFVVDSSNRQAFSRLYLIEVSTYQGHESIQVSADGSGSFILTDELVGATLNPDIYMPDTTKTLEIIQKVGDTFVISNSVGTDGIDASTVAAVRWMYKQRTETQIGGSTVTATLTANTGTGILGGSGAGSMQGGTGTSILRGAESKPAGGSQENSPAGNENPGGSAADPAAELTYIVTEKQDCLNLSVFRDGQQVNFLGLSKIAIRTPYTLPSGFDVSRLYVVFRNADGSLTAVAAKYDAASGELTFETGNTGDFVVVSFSFSGTEFSSEFYAALAELSEVKALA